MSVDVDTNFDSLLFVDLAKRNETKKEIKENLKVDETIEQSIHVREGSKNLFTESVRRGGNP